MAKFRKKPIVIEAVQILAEIEPLEAFAGESWGGWDIGGVYIHTLEGKMRGDAGDWLIKGVNGEIYPCKEEIFYKTYDPVTGPEHDHNAHLVTANEY